MKTKEQILQEHVDKEQIDSLGENVWPDILEAMEDYRNQPSGEGVKSAEEYLDDVLRLTYSARNGFIPQKDVLKALTAQARDCEREMEAFGEYVIKRKVEEYNLGLEYAGTNKFVMHASVPELLNDFRNDRSKPKE